MSSVEIEPKTALRSGDWLTVRASWRGAGDAGPDNRFGVRVRSLQTAQVVFTLDLTAREPSLSEPGAFEVTVDLQMNMGRGYFSIETPIWNIRERRELGQGPQAVTSVDMAGFHGGYKPSSPREGDAARVGNA